MQQGRDGGRPSRPVRAGGPGARQAEDGRTAPRRRGSAGRTRDGRGERGCIVAGYRLVRLIGQGERSEVYLAHPAHGSRGDGDGPRNVAVKIVAPTARARGDAEALALQAVASDHVVRLLDVATLADGGLCLVQSLCSRGSAAALVARRGSLAPAEVVTLVASVLRGVGDLHDVGLTHGALDLTHVLVDASGRPVITGLGFARPVDGDPDSRDEDDEDRRGEDPFARDLARVARIAAALRAPAGARQRASDAAWDTWLALLEASAHGEEDLTAHDLADRLLDVAEASPLADAWTSIDEQDPSELQVLSRGVRGGSTEVAPRSQPAQWADGRLTGVRVERPAPRRARGSGTSARRHRAPRVPPGRRAVERVRTTRSAVRHELARVRPRVWVLGSATLVLVTAVALALPALSDSADGASGAEATPPQPPVSTSEGAEAVPTSPGAVTAADTETSPEGDSGTDTDADAVMSMDPDAAAPSLLRLRAACLRGADVSCLDAVDQPGSAAEDADRTRVRTAPAVDPDPRLDLHESDHLDPAQRLGDTALISLRPVDDAAAPPTPERRPASLLVVRGEAGWRIRDLMDDR